MDGMMISMERERKKRKRREERQGLSMTGRGLEGTPG